MSVYNAVLLVLKPAVHLALGMLNSFFLKFELWLLKFELNLNFVYAAAVLPLNPGPRAIQPPMSLKRASDSSWPLMHLQLCAAVAVR